MQVLQIVDNPVGLIGIMSGLLLITFVFFWTTSSLLKALLYITAFATSVTLAGYLWTTFFS